MSYMRQQQILEDLNYYNDRRNRVHGWPDGFDQASMTITVEMDRYLSREEAASMKLPSPEEVLGNRPDYWKDDQPWTVDAVLDWIVDDGQKKYLYEEVPIRLYAKFEVCDTCNGKGSHVNPSIDCCGLTRDDFDRDPDFYDDYRSGVYDQPCNACRGTRVYPHVDRDSCDPEVLRLLDQRAQDEADFHAERMAEMRMGC